MEKMERIELEEVLLTIPMFSSYLDLSLLRDSSAHILSKNVKSVQIFHIPFYCPSVPCSKLLNNSFFQVETKVCNFRQNFIQSATPWCQKFELVVALAVTSKLQLLPTITMVKDQEVVQRVIVSVIQ